MLQALILQDKKLVVAPSANITGQKTGTKIENIIYDFNNKVDYIIDCGNIENSISSTIVKVEDNKIYIQREGRISKEELQTIALIKE